jgi:hypothetical protein
MNRGNPHRVPCSEVLEAVLPLTRRRRAHQPGSPKIWPSATDAACKHPAGGAQFARRPG